MSPKALFNPRPHVIALFIISLLISLTLTACGSSPSSDSGPGPGPNPGTNPAIINGQAIKGPVSGGTVMAYSLTAAGRKGTILNTTTTDINGNYSLFIDNYTGSVLLEITGGSYVDEATGNTINLPTMADSAGSGLQSIVSNITPGSTLQAQITPLTTMATALAHSMPGGLNATNIQTANLQVGNTFGGIDILNTAPMNPLVSNSATGSTQAAIDYGLILAGFSQQAQTSGVTNPLDLISALAQDFLDGTLDSRSGSTPIQLLTGTGSLATAIGTFNNDVIHNVSGGTVSATLATALQITTGVNQFDGTYILNYNTTRTAGSLETGRFTITVANGLISATVPGGAGNGADLTLSGAVSASGAVTIVSRSACMLTLTGQATIPSTGSAVMTGSLSEPVSSTCDGSSGTWSAIQSTTTTGIGVFDGTYEGSWSSADQGASDTGTLTFTVANGVMTGIAGPGTISTGMVSPSGALEGSGLFNGHLNCIGGSLTVAFTGQITLTSTGGAEASGTFTDPSTSQPNCMGSSGPWTATRRTAVDVIIPPVSSVVSLLSNAPLLTNPSTITTDGVNLYIGDGSSILSLTVGGGTPTTLYTSATPCCVVGLTRVGTDLFWIDPNGDPDATAIFRGSVSGGPVTKIYSGVTTGQTIVDGADITTDGTALYTTDYVQGRVHSLNTDGSGITFLNSRFGGFFDLEHYSTLAESGGGLYIADSGDRTDVSSPAILSIPKGGGSFTTLYSGSPLVNLRDIAVGDGMIYVADPGANNTIWRVPIAGGKPTVVASGSPFVRIDGLVYLNDALYVTDSGNTGSTDGPGAIFKIDLSTPSTGTSQFDGTYALNYSTTRTGGTIESGTFTITVANGVISAIVPGGAGNGADLTLSGIVSASGGVTIGSNSACNLTLTGQATMTSSGEVSMTGTLSEPVTSTCDGSSGTWTTTTGLRVFNGTYSGSLTRTQPTGTGAGASRRLPK